MARNEAAFPIPGGPLRVGPGRALGTTNQLLAGRALLLISLYLARQGRRIIYTLARMIFVAVFTTWAMVLNLQHWFQPGGWHLVAIGACVLLLEACIILEGCRVRFARGRQADEVQPPAR